MELLKNPFFALGATLRDNKRRIIDLAEEKSLVSDESDEADEAAVRNARAMLSNPRRRLAAEIGWLPGVGPKRISKTLSILKREPAKVRQLRFLPSLARANLLADGLIRAVEHLPKREVARWIIELADTHNDIRTEQTITLLNEERSVAGFPAISKLQVVDAELQGRRHYYRQAIKRALNLLSPPSIVEVVTAAINEATENGDSPAPILIDDLVDGYEVEAQEFFDRETKNIAVLVQDVRSAVERDEEHEYIGRLLLQLEDAVKNWDWVAQPIQVSARSRGTSHDLSHEIAVEIRSLAIDLFNEHGLLDISKKLTDLLQEVFAEVDRVAERSAEDAAKLDGIAKRRAQFLAEMEARAESWNREITYEADVGLLFKDKLRISPDGVQWKGAKIPLEEIKRVRWGGTRNSVNGIPTGTTYSIFVGGERDVTTIELKKQQIYLEFVKRLWKTAGVRLLTEMLEGLRAGNRYRFGTAIVTDYGVELERRKLFSANQLVSCKWTDLIIGNGDGAFYIAKKDEKKVAVELPYQDMDNVHILEAAMRAFWKSASPRLSDLLEKTK